MPLQIIQGDITKLRMDAIVNAANNSLLGGSGVDGCIHRAAGPELLAECRTLHGCLTGEAKITKGYKLPAKYVIHTVGPIWSGKATDAQLLKNCFVNSLNLAKEQHCESLAFPLISAGIYGYPKAEVLEIATAAIAEFLQTNEMDVYIVLFAKTDLQIDKVELDKLRSYVEANLWDDNLVNANIRVHDSEGSVMAYCSSAERDLEALENLLKHRDESFSQMLLRKIDEVGITDVECYKRANVDRKLFSKIRSDIHYHPKKVTAVAFAIALHLSEEETREMLEKAGFALSKSSIFDLIILFYIQRGKYDIYKINKALFAYDQCLLGTK